MQLSRNCTVTKATCKSLTIRKKSHFKLGQVSKCCDRNTRSTTACIPLYSYLTTTKKFDQVIRISLMGFSFNANRIKVSYTCVHILWVPLCRRRWEMHEVQSLHFSFGRVTFIESNIVCFHSHVHSSWIHWLSAGSPGDFWSLQLHMLYKWDVQKGVGEPSLRKHAATVPCEWLNVRTLAASAWDRI